MVLKLLHIADTHLGYSAYHAVDKMTGMNVRELDVYRAFDRVVELAIKLKPDVVYAKSWGCLEYTSDAEESMRISRRYINWKCTVELMESANRGAYYMHCLPADRGYEVDDEVIDGKWSIVFDEAENRLHVQKAIMALTMR